MAKVFEAWTVLEHSPPEKLADNLWTVVGDVPKMSLKRRMTLIRLKDGNLLVHNPIALNDGEMEEVEGWGKLAYIVVPNGWHRLDSKIFKQKFPAAKIVCPRGSKKKVEEVVPVDLTYDQFPQHNDVQFTHIKGLNDAEGVLEMPTEAGIILIFNDLIFNIPHQSGSGGFFLRLMGSSGGPKVTRFMKLFGVKNKQAVRDHLRQLAQKHPEIRYIIPGHGNIIEEDCNLVLNKIADAL